MRIRIHLPMLILWALFSLASWPSELAIQAAIADDASADLGGESRARAYDQQVIQQQLEALAIEKLQQGLLTGFSAAVVDDQQLVWARGFGIADEATEQPAASDTLYRVGSISKLLTAVAGMQLVEQKKVDLDAPVNGYLPEFRIGVPFADAKPITLRMLMCHRAGMIRESPVGGYFDGDEPSVEETVASIAACALVNPPGTTYRYSNVGPTIVGQVVARVAGVDFETYQQEHVLGPLGMTSSTFRIARVNRDRLATGYMRVANEAGGFRREAAPLFELGTLPAGNLYSSAEDLARFASALMAGGSSGGRPVISLESLAEMWKPQLTDAELGFGLGFYVGTHRTHQRISHSGAVYGHSSVLYVLPQKKIAAIVLANEDISSGPVQQLAAGCLDLMLAAKYGEANGAPAETHPLEPEQRAAFAGTYLSESYWAKVELVDDQLQVNISGQTGTLHFVGHQFEVNGRYFNNSPVVFGRNDEGIVESFTALNQTFKRIDPTQVVPLPVAWRGLLGSYGPSYIPLIVTEKYGCLFAMTENMMDYRLAPQNRVVFDLPPGLYTDEELVFQTDSEGRAHSVILANMRLERID